jgi:hypothetical protein
MCHLPEARARMNYQIMLHAQGRFGNYLKRMPGKQIIILVDASGERILDRDDAALCFAANHRVENVFKGKAGDRFYPGPEYLTARMLAEGTWFTLKSDPSTTRYGKKFLGHIDRFTIDD